MTAAEYADAAHESLTVNDKLLLGISHQGRTYALGDAQIRPTHLPPSICSAWPTASAKYRAIMELVRLVRDARRQAYGACSRMFAFDRAGSEILEAQQVLDEQLAGAHVYLLSLEKALEEYFVWYDQLVQRPTTSSRGNLAGGRGTSGVTPG